MCPIIGYNGTNIVPIIGQISRVDLYVDKTQCWLDGLVGWWFGRGWYVIAQQDYHLSNIRAIAL